MHHAALLTRDLLQTDALGEDALQLEESPHPGRAPFGGGASRKQRRQRHPRLLRHRLLCCRSTRRIRLWGHRRLRLHEGSPVQLGSWCRQGLAPRGQNDAPWLQRLRGDGGPQPRRAHGPFGLHAVPARLLHHDRRRWACRPRGPCCEGQRRPQRGPGPRRLHRRCNLARCRCRCGRRRGRDSHGPQLGPQTCGARRRDGATWRLQRRRRASAPSESRAVMDRAQGPHDLREAGSALLLHDGAAQSELCDSPRG
mmetsp:Transcript_90919/g.252975  ORF Transcript_90919/g.252975 Transcript_90919/m.252975 type:complete len:254 (+) Transcript_90919:1755-2516(+)